MNIVEKEAVRYSRDVNTYQTNLSVIKRDLNSKLYDFSRERDKLDFLRILKNEVNTKFVEHEAICQNKHSCSTSESLEMLLFAISQEYDDINQYFTPEVSSEDEFSNEEEVKLHVKINEILESLSHLKMGQEIIYDELDTLRQHFNLGKKSWFQLLKAKLVDVVGATIIEKAVAENIYTDLAQEVGNVTTYIESQVL